MTATLTGSMTAGELLDELNLRFEACVAFVDDGRANLICAACGWLRDEHPASAA